MNKLSEYVEGSKKKGWGGGGGVSKKNDFFLRFSVGKLYFETTDFPKQNTDLLLPISWKSGTRWNSYPRSRFCRSLDNMVRETASERRRRRRRWDRLVRVRCCCCAVHILGVHTADDVAMPHHLSHVSPPLSWCRWFLPLKLFRVWNWSGYFCVDNLIVVQPLIQELVSHECRAFIFFISSPGTKFWETYEGI
jgi:hypothetical protein